MKKIYYAMLTLLCAALVSSCSKGSGELLDAIPDDVNVAGVVNVNALVESAGGSISDNQVKLPKEVEDLLPALDIKDLDEINEVLKNSGLDLNYVAFAASEKYNLVGLLKVKDEKKFKATLEELDYEEEDTEDNLALYKKGYTQYMALSKGIAYTFTCWDEKPMRMIRKFIEAAKESSFSKVSVSSYVLEGNTAGVAVKMPKSVLDQMKQLGMPKEGREILEGYICFNASLNNNEAQIKGKIFNEEGKSLDISKFKQYCDIKATVDQKALKYMSSDEMLVAAVAYKDVNWEKMMEEVADALPMSRSDKRQLNEVVEYLKDINGTVAIGLGVTNGLESLISLNYGSNINENFAATLVVEMKDGKTKTIISDLEELLNNLGVKYEETKNGFTSNLGGVEIYCEGDGNFVVLSNHEIKSDNDNATVKDVNFGKYNGAMGVVADAKSTLMKSLGLDFGVKAEMFVKGADSEMGMNFKIDGGKAKGFIAKIIELCNAAMEQSGDYAKTYDKIREKSYSSYSYDNSDYYDYNDMDNMAVAEECIEALEEDYAY